MVAEFNRRLGAGAAAAVGVMVTVCTSQVGDGVKWIELVLISVAVTTWVWDS